jgi:hypothetical protein
MSGGTPPGEEGRESIQTTIPLYSRSQTAGARNVQCHNHSGEEVYRRWRALSAKADAAISRSAASRRETSSAEL